jgi:hypothetical protein
MTRAPQSPKVRLEVTAEIITASLARDSTHCMIAETLKRARPDAKSIAVDLATIRFTDSKKGVRYTYLTPRIAQVQLVNFDQGRKPEPFSFVLRGAHVTRKGPTKPPKHMTEKQKQQRTESGRKLNEKLKRTKLVVREKGSGTVPDRVGGAAPPMQIGADGVPFSRRRAFGLRALEY